MEPSFSLNSSSQSGQSGGGFRKFVGWLIVITIIVVALMYFDGFFNKSAPVPVAPIVEKVANDPRYAVIGKSIEGRKIESYTFGQGENHIGFVGGIHGGYEWNSIMLAQRMVDYFTDHPEIVSKNVTVSIVPNANPDGLFKLIGRETDNTLSGRFTLADIPKGENISGVGRFNANNVDLNRNFDCKWQPESTWRNKKESAGGAVFSEPEAVAIRDFIDDFAPKSVVFWHSQSGAVYASQCKDGILPATIDLMNAYAKAGSYKSVKVFDAYQTTGDAESWLANIGIPSITVELTTHDTVEFDKNLAGVEAVMGYYK